MVTGSPIVAVNADRMALLAACAILVVSALVYIVSCVEKNTVTFRACALAERSRLDDVISKLASQVWQRSDKPHSHARDFDAAGRPL